MSLLLFGFPSFSFPTLDWDIVLLLSSSCDDFSVKYFPFDRQTCEIVFDSIRIPANIANFNSSFLFPVEEKFIGQTENWEMDGPIDKIQEFYRPNEYENVTRIRFQMKFRRKLQYYISNIFMTTVALMILQGATLLMAPDDSNRASFSITVQLAYAVILTQTNGLLPVTSEICYTGLLVASNFAIGSVITIYILAMLSLSNQPIMKKRITRKQIQFSRFIDITVGLISTALCILLYVVYVEIVTSQYLSQ